MKFDRRVYIVATLFLALFLFTSNAYADLTATAGDNGSVLLVSNPDGSGMLTVTPDSLYQLDELNLYQVRPNNRLNHLGTFPVDCLPLDGDCSVGGFNITYINTGLVVEFSYSGLQGNYTVDASFELAPVASFEIDSNSPPSDTEEPDVTVQFNDTSTINPSSLSWDFGDGNTSTSPNPVHTFTAADTYPVTLKVYNTLGQEADSYTLDYTVKVPTIAYQASAGANGSITPSGTVIVDEGSTTTFTIAPEPESLYQVADVLVDGISVGALTSVTFEIDDIADHSISASFEPIPVVASFSASTVSGDLTTTDEVQFTDTSEGNSLSSWTWDFGDGTIITGGDPLVHQNPVHTFAEAGDYTVTLEVGNAAISRSTFATYTVASVYSSNPVTVGDTQVGYGSIMGAYNVIPTSGETIKMKAGEITEDLIFDDPVTFELKGGYDDSFVLDDGYTKIKGNLRILYGTVIVSKVIVAPAF